MRQDNNIIIDQNTGEITDIIVKDDNGKLTVEQTVIDAMIAIEEQKKLLDSQFNTYRAALKAAMEQYGVPSITGERIKVTYIEDGETVRLDGKKVKEEYPRIYDECTTVSPRKAYVKVTIR